MLQSNEKQREQAKLRMQKMRNKKGVTTDSVTKEDVTQEMVAAAYVEGVNGRMYEALPERPRYLKLSDGQVLDRLNQPQPNRTGWVEMMRCNEAAYNYVPTKARKR